MARWGAWAALLVLALPVLALILARPSSLGLLPEPGLQRHPASHVIRVTAKLTFDGKPVEIDDLVDCKTTYRGTPTSTLHLTFALDRRQIAAETPDGGAIVIRVSRSFCYVYGNTWGDMFPEFTPPDGWTPVIEWYDRRDPREAETGIIYLSRTALNAENGRLRVIEPFRIAIPEHPASEALIAEAARQAEEQREEQELRFSYRFRGERMEWMFRIPEEGWRDPKRAKAAFDVDPYKRRGSKIEPEALARYLDGLGTGTGVVALGSLDNLPEPASRVLGYLRAGRDASLVDIYEQGIPSRTIERFGLLISKKSETRMKRLRFKPDFFDEFIPFTCVEGVMTPGSETPGLMYWFRDRCSHADHYKGVDFFGKPITGEFMPLNELIFDIDTHSLWWLNTSH